MKAVWFALASVLTALGAIRLGQEHRQNDMLDGKSRYRYGVERSPIPWFMFAVAILCAAAAATS